MHQVTHGRVPAGRRRVPHEGDILASRPRARADSFAISVTPAAAHAVATRYDGAVASSRERARQHGVDAWFMCDHIHLLRIAHHRSEETS